MKLFTALLFLFSAVNDVTAVLRGSALNAADTVQLLSRQLEGDNIQDFVPLACNANLSSATCSSWSTKFGTATSYSSRVVIPCGECVTMDLDGGSLALKDGLDVYGKLVFPDGYKLNLSTTMIAVQGELEITASKPVDGLPNIMFTMIGNDDAMTFTPIDVNANKCKGVSTCDVGKKGIVVAGGKVNIHGLPSNTTTWTRLYDVRGDNWNNPDTIVVDNSVKGKWAPGAEILITSHTRVWNESQVRTIKDTWYSNEEGYVAFKLNAPIIRPTTLKESPDFAVEVALLSRNILFEGGEDSEARHGGHFMIMHTPSVVQTIEGVEVKNFGQQGTLGKYPIHFHFCNDVAGSVISKNTIRQSNQRCVVVHGTNKLIIEQNVAFDTKGHCFLTEDGMETGNKFIRNLGAQTGIPETIIPNGGPNGDETDGAPATFWITNPTNSFTGNVAAGSESSGFWFEPKLRGLRAYLYPNYNPMFAPLTLFKDNVAHSNIGTTGAVQMYKPGYMPNQIATLDGLKSYRNDASGIFVHKNYNIVIVNGIFADNNIGVDIDRAQGIVVRDTVIIGESPSYRQLMANQTVGTVCRQKELKGLDLHTWKLDKARGGVTIDNVNFSGFSNVACENPSSIHMDDMTLEQGTFELYTEFKGVTLQDGADSIDFCTAVAAGIDTIYLIDSDGRLRPSSSIPSVGPATLVSNGPQILKFVEHSKITNVEAGCYSYCRDTCFRSVRYEVAASEAKNIMLKVCRTFHGATCSMFAGSLRVNGNLSAEEARNETVTFIAHLPILVNYTYKATFLDNTGERVKLSSVVAQYEHSLCPDSDFFSVALEGVLPGPPPTP